MQILSINFTLLVPASLVFVMLLLHCYLYRGLRLTLVFFGSAFLHVLIKELTHTYIQYKFDFALRPYWVLGASFQIFGLPFVIYMGWAITFYLSWYFAEKILKRIGYFSDNLFHTIVFSLPIAGALSYCVETTAIFSGWWLWTSPDPRLRDFLVVPFSALQAWPAQTAQFLLIFFFAECSKYRAQWWKAFFYNFIAGIFVFAAINYSFMNYWRITPRILDVARILIPILLMFLYPVQFKFTRLSPPDSNKNRNHLFYDTIPILALILIIFTCIIMDSLVLKKPALAVSALPLIVFIMLSIKKLRLTIIVILLIFALIYGGRRLYILSIPIVVFFMFIIYGKLLERIKNE